MDIIEYVSRKLDKLSRVIQTHTHTHTHKFPQKLQLNVERTLQKPSEEETEKVSLIFNTETMTISFWDFMWKLWIIDNIVSKLVISSYGSGWQLISIDKVTLKPARCVAVRSSGYMQFHEGHSLRRDSN